MLPTVGEEEKDEGLVESLGHVDPEAVRLVHSLQPVGRAPLKLKFLEGLKVFENFFLYKNVVLSIGRIQIELAKGYAQIRIQMEQVTFNIKMEKSKT